MAANFPSLKFKNVVSDENIEDDNTSGRLSLEKLKFNCKKKLLVLSPGGLIMKRVYILDRASVQAYTPDFSYRNFLVFKRPFCADFLNFCFERFEVGIWSSANKHNVNGILNSIMDGVKGNFAFVWDQSDSTNSGFQTLENPDKSMFLKELNKIWENDSRSLPWCNGEYSFSNTLLIDDDPYNALLNPPNTAIFPLRYMLDNGEDTFLGPKGEMQVFLDGVANSQDVPSYVKDHPLGHPAITPFHPNWDYYSKIVNKFAAKKLMLGSNY